MITKKYFSPAKVNLFLRVLKKRCDQFHEIATLIQMLSFGDDITFQLKLEEGSDSYQSNLSDLHFDENHSVYKALNIFRAKVSPKAFSVNIHLNKKIPMQAGLGGGSSNAATTLFALNELLKTGLSSSKLTDLAGEIGSDVPSFFSTGCAYCQGRGEIITSVEPASKKEFHLIKQKNAKSSTPLVYQKCTPNVYSSKPGQFYLDSFLEGNPEYVNELEAPVFSALPQLKDFKDMLIKSGYQSVMMTGSGSAFIAYGEPNIKLQNIWIQKVKPIFRKQNIWY